MTPQICGVRNSSDTFQPIAETPRTVRQIAEAGAGFPEDLQRSVMRFAKGVCASTRKGELMKERFSIQIQAEKARKARKAAANRVL